ncbi:uncharacterized protein N0V89_002111 [Didymosphaeria variabile]|uniref:BTB domain-containing protein n=1 Tax=Didymosphaeria variabile TaxID=1932322 RepID=A0A9W8XR24_9PLEO|nr:uncharacterized protein N0V89_002111 [Didymosphaeria variabile]KAJ4357535.1 hypothetical protein N0V89_002111 [Didymosphaeria variabile]
MAPSFDEVLQTRLFTFLIGADETPIVVHAGAIARLSEPLDRLVNGHMAESQDNVARFSDLEVEDFSRICEFAYRGTYTRPKPKRFSDGEVDAATQMFHLADPISPFFAARPYDFEHDRREESPEFAEDDHCEDSPGCSGSSVFGDLTSPITSFRSFQNPHHGSRLEWPVVSSENRSWRDNFAPALLGHARLYAFAEQYLITALKNKALQSMRDTLSGYTLFVSGLEAVIRLARFAYDSDHIPDREGKVVDPLRQVVVAYVVAHHKHFQNYAGHRHLLEAQNEYATDVLDYVANWFDPDAEHERHENDQGDGWPGLNEYRR